MAKRAERISEEKGMEERAKLDRRSMEGATKRP